MNAPIQSLRLEAAPVATPVRTTFRGKGEWVLVVDDDEAIRNLLKFKLEQLYFKVLLACDGAEALTRFAEHRADIQFILTDLNMPRMDGLALARSVRQLALETQIIVMTGFRDEEKEQILIEVGRTHILQKPFNQLQFVEMLQTVCR